MGYLFGKKCTSYLVGGEGSPTRGGGFQGGGKKWVEVPKMGGLTSRSGGGLNRKGGLKRVIVPSGMALGGKKTR